MKSILERKSKVREIVDMEVEVFLLLVLNYCKLVCMFQCHSLLSVRTRVESLESCHVCFGLRGTSLGDARVFTDKEMGALFGRGLVL